MSGACAGGWLPDAGGWVQPDGGGTISLIDSPTGEIDILNPAGPTASLSIAAIGAFTKVANLTDLDNVTTGSPVRTLTKPIVLAGPVVLPAGESLVVTALTPIAGIAATVSGITGNVSGPLISGPLFAQDIFAVNLDVTGSIFALSAAANEIVFLANIICQGAGAGATVGSINAVLGNFAFNNLFCSGFTTGWTMSGSLGAWRIFQCAFASSAPTLVGFEVEASAVLTTIGLFDDCTLTDAAPTEILFRFSDAATYPTPDPGPTDVLSIELSNCRAEGATMVDESIGNLNSRSGALLIRGGVGTRASDYIGGVGFLNPSAPLTVAYVGIDTFTPIPWTDGVTSVAPSNAMERFAFVRASTGGAPDAAFPLDWALQYMFGPSNVDVALTFNTTVSNGGGGGTPNVQGRIEYDPFGGPVAWQGTPSVGLTQQQNRLQSLTSTTSVLSGVSPGDQFRWTSSVDAGPTDTVVSLFDMFVTVRA